MKYLLLFSAASFLSIEAGIAQNTNSRFRVEFHDKAGSPYSILQPQQYLSPKAIQRREKQNIAIIDNDIPVLKAYLDSIVSAGGIVINTSRWFNSAIVSAPDSLVQQRIMSFPFIKSFKGIALLSKESASRIDKFGDINLAKHAGHSDAVSCPFEDEYIYGKGFNQISILYGITLHKLGFRGSGMSIAVIDAGFPNVQNLPVFQKMISENRLSGGWDFAEGNGTFLDDDTHGTMVLSTMAADLPGQLTGTAPEASYFLLRSEEGATEYVVEEDNWVAAAEFADSAGVEIINTSLGYTTYDDSTQSYSYADMNGNTALITRGADIASSKGMLIVVSAGNSGNSSWHYIGAPADADSVLAIGAVTKDKAIAGFSSRGPSADGRVKPNVCAQGQASAIATPWGTVTTGNGTSFASPILAGMAACLWQAIPDASSFQIKKAIEESCNGFLSPNDNFGYGIPNFSLAYMLLSGSKTAGLDRDDVLTVYPNPFTGNMGFTFYSAIGQELEYSVSDMSGREIIQAKCRFDGGTFNYINIDEGYFSASGVYVLSIKTSGRMFNHKLIKN